MPYLNSEKHNIVKVANIINLCTQNDEAEGSEHQSHGILNIAVCVGVGLVNLMTPLYGS